LVGFKSEVDASGFGCSASQLEKDSMMMRVSLCLSITLSLSCPQLLKPPLCLYVAQHLLNCFQKDDAASSSMFGNI